MRRSTSLFARGAKGYGWYNKFMEGGNAAFEKYPPPTPFDWTANKVKRPTAYLEIAIDKEPQGKLVFELASDIAPVSVVNFLNLCNGSNANKLTYTGTSIHRVFKNHVLMGGDVENHDGTGSYSSFGQKYFRDENFIIPHSHRGLLSYVSTGVNTNGSQFYIGLGENKHMNGRCVVFGRLIAGSNILDDIEKVQWTLYF